LVFRRSYAPRRAGPFSRLANDSFFLRFSKTTPGPNPFFFFPGSVDPWFPGHHGRKSCAMGPRSCSLRGDGVNIIVFFSLNSKTEETPLGACRRFEPPFALMFLTTPFFHSSRFCHLISPHVSVAPGPLPKNFGARGSTLFNASPAMNRSGTASFPPLCSLPAVPSVWSHYPWAHCWASEHMKMKFPSFLPFLPSVPYMTGTYAADHPRAATFLGGSRVS